MKNSITELIVRWGETDQAGIVFYPNFFGWFDIAEHEFFRSFGISIGDLFEKDKVSFAIGEAWCKFLSPARYDDILEIHTSISEIREKSITLNFDIYKKEDKTLLAKGYGVHICVNLDDNKRVKSIKIPDYIIDKIKEAI